MVAEGVVSGPRRDDDRRGLRAVSAPRPHAFTREPALNALVTGAGGFVGRWLLDALVEGGWSVTAGAVDRPADADARAGAITWALGDMRDAEYLTRVVDASKPNAVFHLAGISHIPVATRDPGLATDVNVGGIARLAGVLRTRVKAGTLDPTVVVVGSGEQYGRHDASDLPLRETADLRPHTVYAATKVAQEVVALEAWRSDGVRVVATRSFNHSGRGQAPNFVLPGLVARASARPDVLRMGNQAPVRDFLHVSDVVAAYIALADRGVPGEAYNVASGQGVSVGELARRVLARLGLDLPVESDPALVRPADVPLLVGDPSKLKAATGWSPRLSLDDLLDDLISHNDAAPE